MSDQRHPLWFDITLLLLAALMFAGMIALGNWQVQRLAWKENLIKTVEARAFAQPVPAPTGPAPEYQRVFATGTFAHDQSLRVKAVTEVGPGFWVMTPLVGLTGTVWVNRGFVPNGVPSDQWNRPEGTVTITGLVRPDQPDGTLLESNRPAAGRWVSADLAEMTRTVELENTQTAYFIDSEAIDTEMPWPRGGLTRLSFRNTHLVYAVTWYAMAALFFAAMIFVIKDRLTGRKIRS